MKKFAAVFPGQGSQSVGMLKDFMANPVVAATFKEADEALGYDLTKICLEGPAEELNKTEVTQPAILTASVAALRAIEEKGLTPAAACGHSLGEYSALVAAGSLDFADAVRLVRLRGKAMQEAVPAGLGAMAAVLGLDDEVIVQACQKVSQENSACYAANFNSPGQVVISGEAQAVDRACAELSAAGAKKVVKLAVSAPSHCPLMQSAADKLKEALGNITVADAKIHVYCNAYAKPLTLADEIKDALYAQLIGPVQWVKCVQAMAADGIEALVEAGPGKVLTGLNRRIDKSLTLLNVSDEAALQKALEALA